MGAADRRADDAADRVARRGASASGCSTRCRRSSPSTCRSIYFAAPRMFVAASPRVTNLTPAVSAPAAAVVAGHEWRWRSRSVDAGLPRAAARVRGRSWCSPCRRRRCCWRGSRRATTRPNRSASARSREAHRADARALRARSIDRRAVPRLARRRGAVRFRPARCRTTGRSRDLIPERAANTAILAIDRARSPPRSSACRSASSPAAAAAASLTGAIRDGVARAAVDAAAAHVAVPRVRRRAHRLAADRRHDDRRRIGRARRSICCATSSCRRRRWRCRSPRCSSGCSRRR